MPKVPRLLSSTADIRQSASSFECDGCNHHASFHSMENKTEDEIRKRWEVEAKDKQALEGDTGRPRKRLRELEYGAEISNARLLDNGLLTPVFDDNDAANNVGLSKSSSAGPTKTKPKKAPARRGAAKKATGRMTEILDEEDDEFIELD